MLGRSLVAILALTALVSFGPSSATSGGTVPQGTQTNTLYARSGTHVSAVTATTQRTSCYTPLVAFATSDGPNDGYTGETTCAQASSNEDLGPYPTQAEANPGYPAPSPMLVKDHSESDLRVDPTTQST